MCRKTPTLLQTFPASKRGSIPLSKTVSPKYRKCKMSIKQIDDTLRNMDKIGIIDLSKVTSGLHYKRVVELLKQDLENGLDFLTVFDPQIITVALNSRHYNYTRENDQPKQEACSSCSLVGDDCKCKTLDFVEYLSRIEKICNDYENGNYWLFVVCFDSSQKLDFVRLIANEADLEVGKEFRACEFNDNSAIILIDRNRISRKAIERITNIIINDSEDDVFFLGNKTISHYPIVESLYNDLCKKLHERSADRRKGQ